jgi:P-type E1-E2 ATPase
MHQKVYKKGHGRHRVALIVNYISDGGNDVGMIQSADVGIGIEGKEGK